MKIAISTSNTAAVIVETINKSATRSMIRLTLGQETAPHISWRMREPFLGARRVRPAPGTLKLSRF